MALLLVLTLILTALAARGRGGWVIPAATLTAVGDHALPRGVTRYDAVVAVSLATAAAPPLSAEDLATPRWASERQQARPALAHCLGPLRRFPARGGVGYAGLFRRSGALFRAGPRARRRQPGRELATTQTGGCRWRVSRARRSWRRLGRWRLSSTARSRRGAWCRACERPERAVTVMLILVTGILCTGVPPRDVRGREFPRYASALMTGFHAAPRYSRPST